MNFVDVLAIMPYYVELVMREEKPNTDQINMYMYHQHHEEEEGEGFKGLLQESIFKIYAHWLCNQ